MNEWEVETKINFYSLTNSKDPFEEKVVVPPLLPDIRYKNVLFQLHELGMNKLARHEALPEKYERETLRLLIEMFYGPKGWKWWQVHELGLKFKD